MTLSIWHLELALIALLLGLALCRPWVERRVGPADLAFGLLAILAVLIATRQVHPWLALALAATVLAAWGWATGTAHLAALGATVLVLSAGLWWPEPTTVRIAATAGLGMVAFTARGAERSWARRPRTIWLTSVLVAAAMIWASAPDTEVALAMGVLMLPFAALTWTSDQWAVTTSPSASFGVVAAWSLSLGLVVVAGSVGYRARPLSVGAALGALAIALVWAWWSRRTPSDRRPGWWWFAILLVIGIVVARTTGLSAERSRHLLIGPGAAVLVAALAWIVERSAARGQPSGED